MTRTGGEERSRDGEETYQHSFRDIVEEDEVTEHGDKAEETEASDHINHSVFQIKFA